MLHFKSCIKRGSTLFHKRNLLNIFENTLKAKCLFLLFVHIFTLRSLENQVKNFPMVNLNSLMIHTLIDKLNKHFSNFSQYKYWKIFFDYCIAKYLISQHKKWRVKSLITNYNYIYLNCYITKCKAKIKITNKVQKRFSKYNKVLSHFSAFSSSRR